jgi:hypothetical protein
MSKDNHEIVVIAGSTGENEKEQMQEKKLPKGCLDRTSTCKEINNQH